MSVKQILVVRNDLKMRKGKCCSQASHGSGDFMKTMLLYHVQHGVPISLTEDELEWMTTGTAKITVRVDSEEELLAIADQARQAGIKTFKVIDEGRTEFHGVKTLTAVALGPVHESIVDPITGHLQLL